jgi:hypothetical protein
MSTEPGVAFQRNDFVGDELSGSLLQFTLSGR